MTLTTAATATRPANRGLVWLGRLLTFATFMLAVGTLLALGTLPASLGTGGIGVHAVLDPPYRVSSSFGPDFSVAGDGGVAAEPEEAPSGVSRPPDVERSSLRATIAVGARDRDSRVIMSVGLLLAIACAWVGLIAVRRVVRSARDGAPFDRRNVMRLHCVAAAVVAVPIVGWAVNQRLEATLGWPGGVHPDIEPVGVGPALIVALVIVALAEVFREGANLSELEQSTI